MTKNDALGIQRIKARIRAGNAEVIELYEGATRLNQRASEFAAELELETDVLIDTHTKDIPDLKEQTLLIRDKMSETMVEVVGLMDAVAKIGEKFAALTGHTLESKGTFDTILREASNLEATATEFRGNYSTLGTLVLSYLSEDMLLALVAADEEASLRALDLIGQNKIEAWLDSQDTINLENK